MREPTEAFGASKAFETEIESGQRFEFGKNWKRFLSTLTPERIAISQNSIKELLEVETLAGVSVLDIGSGSGLSSLAMRNLGAKVCSFDYDPESVACTRTLRQTYHPSDEDWSVRQGSILDKEFVSTLGSFDLVYSWGVLHHTGSMWEAIERAASLVKNKGTLFVALYNNQGRRSKHWTTVKRYYCSGTLGKILVSSVFIPGFAARLLISCAVRRENAFATYKRHRGMSITHDWSDWLGGFPFEVASVEEVFHFLGSRGFRLVNLKTTNGLGNNEFVFLRD